MSRLRYLQVVSPAEESERAQSRMRKHALETTVHGQFGGRLDSKAARTVSRAYHMWFADKLGKEDK